MSLTVSTLAEIAPIHQLRGYEKPSNLNLNNAFNSKKDEFFTQYDDIAAEMAHHEECLRGKVILCNCDAPSKSEFVSYFLRNFRRLGLSRLIVTNYRDASAPCDSVSAAVAEKLVVNNVPPELAAGRTKSSLIRELTRLLGNELTTLNGDGDFRSNECISILQDADVVVTNPPFSLFREYIGQLVSFEKDFVVLGNMNASTTKQIFPLFQRNKVWYGESIKSGDRKFIVPEDYNLNAAGCGIDSQGKRFIRVKGVRWFTNLNTKKRHHTLPLHSAYDPHKYPTYENYNAINVSRTQDIPRDFYGLMGVPITFLDKYNPDQFEIVMLANGNARTNVSAGTLMLAGYRPHPEDRGGVGILSGQRVYARILIRRKS